MFLALMPWLFKKLLGPPTLDFEGSNPEFWLFKVRLYLRNPWKRKAIVQNIVCFQFSWVLRPNNEPGRCEFDYN